MQLTTIKLIRTDSGHPDFVELVKLLDAELAERGRYWEVASDGLEPWLGPVRSGIGIQEWS